MRGKARVLAINASIQAAPWADVWYACDPEFWDQWHGYETDAQRWTQNADAARKHNLNHIQSQNYPGFSDNPEIIHQGANSGFQALNMALLWGAERIILLGYDMQVKDPKHPHFFGLHKGMRNPSPTNTAHWVEKYKTAVKTLDRFPGQTVINCSRETALECFTRKNLEEVI